MSSVGTEKWNGMVGGGGDGFEASDAGGNVFNEVVTGHVAFGSRKLGRSGGTTVGRRGKMRGDRGRGKGNRRGSTRGEKSRKNVVAIVDNGCEGRVLYLGEEEGGWSWWIGWKEADELECFSMGAVASNAVILGDGFVEGGRNVKKPGAAEL